MLQVDCYQIEKYEVKIVNKPIKTFFAEEEALEFIEQNYNDFVFMRRIEYAVLN